MGLATALKGWKEGAVNGSLRIAAGVLALLLGALFVLLFVPIIQQTLAATEKPKIDAGFATFASTVSSAVAGAIAVWFGVPGPGQRYGSRLLAWSVGESVRNAVGWAYLGVFVVITGFATYSWAAKQNVAPDVLTSEVTVALGVAVAVVMKLMSQSGD
jgi:hypothetical protein